MNHNTSRRRRVTQQLKNKHIRQQRKRWESIRHKHSNKDDPQNF